MSEQTMENHGRAFLVLLLPISFLIIFLVSTWRILVILALLVIGFQLFSWYQWEHWRQQVDPIFNQLVKENQGKITPIDLAIKGNFSGTKAKKYLDSKATEFSASIMNSQEGGQSYYFITASVLGDIFNSSEPVKEIPEQPLPKTARLLLAKPPSTEQELETEFPPEEPQRTLEKLETEFPPEEPQRTLEKQLVFGSLIQSELAKRLNVYSSTVYKRRNDPDFSEWTRNRDPDGIAWTYSHKAKEFFPLEKS